jgi:hypothetical protein
MGRCSWQKHPIPGSQSEALTSNLDVRVPSEEDEPLIVVLGVADRLVDLPAQDVLDPYSAEVGQMFDALSLCGSAGGIEESATARTLHFPDATRSVPNRRGDRERWRSEELIEWESEDRRPSQIERSDARCRRRAVAR